jgi:hypothetical protein
MQLEQQTLCRYHRMENGIHEFVMLSAKREAIDAYIDQLAPIYSRLPEFGTLYAIIDESQSGTPSVAYMSQSIKLMFAENQPRRPICMAVIFNQTIMVSLLETIRTLLAKPGFDDVRFFTADQREAAVCWLEEEAHSQFDPA